MCKKRKKTSKTHLGCEKSIKANRIEILGLGLFRNTFFLVFDPKSNYLILFFDSEDLDLSNNDDIFFL